MPNNYAYGSEDLGRLIPELGPASKNFGDLCGFLEKMPPWYVRWVFDLQLNHRAMPTGPGSDAATSRKHFKRHPEAVAKSRELGKLLVNAFCTFPGVNVDKTRQLDRAGADAIYSVTIQLRELGRVGAHVMVLMVALKHWLAIPLESPGNGEPPASKAHFYAVRCAASVFALQVSACLSTASNTELLSVFDEESKSAICAGIKKLCEYSRLGRDLIGGLRRAFRAADKGAVCHDGIVARNWHEAAVQIAERTLELVRRIVDPSEAMAPFAGVVPAYEVVINADLETKWAAIAAQIGILPEIKDVQLLQLQLECELEVAMPTAPDGAAHMENVVKLAGQGNPVTVNSKVKPALTTAQYNVVQAVLEAKDGGLNKDELVGKSGHSDAVKILKRVALLDHDWGVVIRLPGKPGGRYRIKTPC